MKVISILWWITPGQSNNFLLVKHIRLFMSAVQVKHFIVWEVNILFKSFFLFNLNPFIQIYMSGFVDQSKVNFLDRSLSVLWWRANKDRVMLSSGVFWLQNITVHLCLKSRCHFSLKTPILMALQTTRGNKNLYQTKTNVNGFPFFSTAITMCK